MAHDPLCPCAPLDPIRPGAVHTTNSASCLCVLIAKVRADTLDKAVQRLEQNVLVGMTLTPKEVGAVIAAVRGES